MKNSILYVVVCMFTVTEVSANQAVCTASEYAKMVCQTVNINENPVRECRSVYGDSSRTS